MPDVRWCHPSIRRASHTRRESKHFVAFRPSAVAPGAPVRQRPKQDPGRAAFRSTCPESHRHLAHVVALQHSGSALALSKRTAQAPRLAGTAHLLIAFYCGHLRRPSSATIRGAAALARVLEWGTRRTKTVRIHPRGLPDAHRASLPSARPAMRPLRATGGTVVPHHLTSACSGLATLAADARR